MKPEERAQVMQTVRNLQESIEKLKRDLQLHSAVSIEEAKKEVILINRLSIFKLLFKCLKFSGSGY